MVELPLKNCTINASTSMYLECGTWLPIDEMIVLDKFSLNQSCTDCPILKASDLILPIALKNEEYTQINVLADGMLYIWSPKNRARAKADIAFWQIVLYYR